MWTRVRASTWKTDNQLCLVYAAQHFVHKSFTLCKSRRLPGALGVSTTKLIWNGSVHKGRFSPSGGVTDCACRLKKQKAGHHISCFGEEYAEQTAVYPGSPWPPSPPTTGQAAELLLKQAESALLPHGRIKGILHAHCNYAISWLMRLPALHAVRSSVSFCISSYTFFFFFVLHVNWCFLCTICHTFTCCTLHYGICLLHIFPYCTFWAPLMYCRY